MPSVTTSNLTSTIPWMQIVLPWMSVTIPAWMKLWQVDKEKCSMEEWKEILVIQVSRSPLTMPVLR